MYEIDKVIKLIKKHFLKGFWDNFYDNYNFTFIMIIIIIKGSIKQLILD